MSDRDFTPLGGETLHEGAIFTLRTERFRFADGAEVERDVVRHPGAVALVAVQDGAVILCRQPREAIGDPDCLELPAGRLDKDGEDPEEAARRELSEEVGLVPGRLELLKSEWSSVGFTDEVVHLYLATDLREESADSGEDERIEVVRWPLEDLDGAIDATQDSKTLIGLLLLQRRLDLGELR